MSESPSPALCSTVAALPDFLLLAQTRQLARHEQALQILVLDHLCEIEARRLHLTRGYGSLFDYVVHELDYTAAAAVRRPVREPVAAWAGSRGMMVRPGNRHRQPSRCWTLRRGRIWSSGRRARARAK